MNYEDYEEEEMTITENKDLNEFKELMSYRVRMDKHLTVYNMLIPELERVKKLFEFYNNSLLGFEPWDLLIELCDLLTTLNARKSAVEIDIESFEDDLEQFLMRVGTKNSI